MSTQFTEERLEELSAQHHLEGGGYAFENAATYKGLDDRHGLVEWEDPDFDYLGVERPDEAWNTTFLFEPYGYRETAWPQELTQDLADGEVQHLRLVSSGWFYEGETECGCCGEYPDRELELGERAEIHPTDDTSRVLYEALKGEPVEVVAFSVSPGYVRVKLLKHDDGRLIDVVKAAVKPAFEFDGDLGDYSRAYPYCSLCDGDGYRTVEPGCYAVYERYELDDEDDEWPEPTEDEPAVSQLNTWLFGSTAEATDGCTVEPDGTCEHGHPSWLVYKELI